MCICASVFVVFIQSIVIVINCKYCRSHITWGEKIMFSGVAVRVINLS